MGARYLQAIGLEDKHFLSRGSAEFRVGGLEIFHHASGSSNPTRRSSFGYPVTQALGVQLEEPRRVQRLRSEVQILLIIRRTTQPAHA